MYLVTLNISLNDMIISYFNVLHLAFMVRVLWLSKLDTVALFPYSKS